MTFTVWQKSAMRVPVSDSRSFPQVVGFWRQRACRDAKACFTRVERGSIRRVWKGIMRGLRECGEVEVGRVSRSFNFA